MHKKTTYIILGLAIFLSVFLHIFRQASAPPCLNADEAALGYNAYSIMKTGRDEHGAFLPLRLASFNDFKLPLYTYMSIPLIKLMGLNDLSIRSLNKIIGILLVPLIYILSQELFKKKHISLLASFMTSTTLWIYLLSRQAHEAVLCAFFVLLGIIFLIKWEKKHAWKYLGLSYTMLFLSTFSYHSGRLFLITLILYESVKIIRGRGIVDKASEKVRIGLITGATLVLPFVVDVIYGANRVKNLFFFQEQGFHLRLAELLREHPNRIIHNKITESITVITARYASQISPDFFLVSGDSNVRFGYPMMSAVTPIFLICVMIGLYYLFKNQHKYRWLILLLLVVSPLGNALTWQMPSLSRTYFIIFPMILTASYGLYSLFEMKTQKVVKKILVSAIITTHIFFLFQSWDIYFRHYFQRNFIVRSWQCGYKDMVNRVKDNYDKADTFYITERYGQPYIFLLFYLGYDPSTYQGRASFTQPDEYGFTQVTSFDKYIFKTPSGDFVKDTHIIGYPDEFNDRSIDNGALEKITYGTEEIFWYYKQ